MMEARPEACPVWTSALEGRGVIGRTLARCVAARRHRQWVFCVAKKATGWSCGQRQTANALGVAAAAIQRSGYLQRCVVVGNDCREGTSRLRDYFLHLQLGLGWMVEVAVVEMAEGVDVGVTGEVVVVVEEGGMAAVEKLVLSSDFLVTCYSISGSCLGI